jgi:phage terminase large subunit-like protein
VIDGVVPDMVRVVVAVDPSGSGDEDNADNDEIGIAVVGLGTTAIAYVLEDCSVKAGPRPGAGSPRRLRPAQRRRRWWAR